MITSPSKIRAYALSISKLDRQGKFTRVSKDFLDRIEAKTRLLVAAEVKSHPSVGRTLY